MPHWGRVTRSTEQEPTQNTPQKPHTIRIAHQRYTASPAIHAACGIAATCFPLSTYKYAWQDSDLRPTV